MENECRICDKLFVSAKNLEKHTIKFHAFNYMEKQYRWTERAKFQGSFNCTCEECQKYVKGLVKDRQLTVKPIPPSDKSEGILGVIL
jgi:hypothetical protein